MTAGYQTSKGRIFLPSNPLVSNLQVPMPQLLGMHWQSLPPCSWDPRVCLANVVLGHCFPFSVGFCCSLFWFWANYGWIILLHPFFKQSSWRSMTYFDLWWASGEWLRKNGVAAAGAPPATPYLNIYIYTYNSKINRYLISAFTTIFICPRSKV